jgi:hypothetical protein
MNGFNLVITPNCLHKHEKNSILHMNVRWAKAILINNYDPKQGLCEKCICKCLGRWGSWFAAGDLCTTVPPQPRANPLSPPASHALRRAVARDSEGVILAKQLDATQRGDSGRRRCWLAFLRLRGSSGTTERVVGENGLRKFLLRPVGLSVSAHAQLRSSGGNFAMVI